MSYEEYKNMNVRIELLEIQAEAEDDVRNVRVAPASETFGDLRKMLQEGVICFKSLLRRLAVLLVTIQYQSSSRVTE